jgi:hypothetical protein
VSISILRCGAGWRKVRWLPSGPAIKWREGQLQIKGLESSLGTQKFTGPFEGKVERWIKWGYEGKSVEDAFAPWFKVSGAGPRIVEVHKTRCLRKVRMNPFTPIPIEVDSKTLIDRGGALEVTDLRVGAQAFTSVAFEAFPNDSGMHGDFTVFVNAFLGKLSGVNLTDPARWRGPPSPAGEITYLPDGLTRQVPKISTLHSPITNLEHPFALSVSDDAIVRTPLTQAAREGLAISTAECKRMFQIGDRRMQGANLRSLTR